MDATRLSGLAHGTVLTPIGELTIVCTADGVLATSFADGPEGTDPDDLLEGLLDGERILASEGGPPRAAGDIDPRGTALEVTHRVARAAAREAEAYFAGRSDRITVPPDLTLVADGFPRRVLEVVATIPYGELWTYGDVAGLAGSPRAARAAGSALAACPIELFVPCHRVVHASGTLGGYGRHEHRKRWLLRHEGAVD